MTTHPATLAIPDLRPARRSPHRRWTLIAVALATFMTLLDNNIINVAIPTIQRDLHLSESGVEWVVSAYILVFAGFLLAGGRLADVFGRKRLFVIGLVVFTVSSLVAGLSGDVGLLIAGRAAQGFGAAMLTPTTLAILTVAFPEPKEQAAAVGAWSAVGALALAVGPLLGGVLSEHANWHWIFFINVPVGIGTLMLGLWAIPSSTEVVRRRIDLPGLAASALALLALTYGLIEGSELGWTSPVILASLVVAVAAAAGFVRIESRTADPMVDLAIFADRTFAGAVTALMMWGFGLFGIYFFTSLYLQDVLGFSATRAGVAFVPMAVLMAAGATVSDRVAARIGTHRSVGAALVLMAAGIISVSFLGSHATFVDLMPGFAVIGIGGGLTIPLTSTVIGVMPAERVGVASALFNAAREVSGLLGITVIGVVLSARRAEQTRLGATPTMAFLSGYRLGLVLAGILVACGGVVAWVALRRVAAPSELMDPAQGRVLERAGVTAHEEDLLDTLRALAAATTPVTVDDVAEGTVPTATLEVDGRHLLLGGLSPVGIGGLRRAVEDGCPLALRDAGRYGPSWWIRLTPAGPPLLVGHVRLIAGGGHGPDVSAEPTDGDLEAVESSQQAG